MSVSIITQTCVRPEKAEEFARWQAETSSAIARFPGFIEQRLMPPKPPLQVDWVILQRFASLEDAKHWLGSNERQKRIEEAAPMLVGRDDVHLVQDEADGITPSPVSAVISTRVRPGKEDEFRAWERKIAIAQSKAPGLQGYRFEPPVPDVQHNHVIILRFNSEANLQAWLDSPVRKKLLEEAEPLTEESHARIVRSGFEQWFRDQGGAASTVPVWKMNLLVLLMLYPIVFLFNVFVGTPLLSERLHLPFALALFLGNIVSVILTGFLVPWVADRFSWWLKPAAVAGARWTNVWGATLVTSIHLATVVGFWWIF
jgi:antibiotic biosynthesis monooxygenase (ABM) superfamily enzyme